MQVIFEATSMGMNSRCYYFIIDDYYSVFCYVLPWGQMSLWAATVITNFLTAIPLVGEDIVVWFWGGILLVDLLYIVFIVFILYYLLL